jgi:hypothetical protein
MTARQRQQVAFNPRCPLMRSTIADTLQRAYTEFVASRETTYTSFSPLEKAELEIINETRAQLLFFHDIDQHRPFRGLKATLASTTASIVMLSLIIYGVTEQVFPVALLEVIIKSLPSIQQQLKISCGTLHMPLALLSTVVPVILKHFASTTVCAGSLRIAQDSGTAGHQHFHKDKSTIASTVVKAPPTSTAFAADRCGNTYGYVERAAGCEYLAAGKFDHDVACGSCKRARLSSTSTTETTDYCTRVGQDKVASSN